MANEDLADQDRRTQLEGVRKWIHREGYPLEYATARELHRSGLLTEQGHYFVDESEAPPKAREIDVVAWFPPPDSDTRVAVRLAVECKHATAPWVVFSTEQDISPVDVLASSTASRSARNVLVRRARLVREQHAVFPDFFIMPRRHGFGVVQAFGRGGDPLEGGTSTVSSEDADLNAGEANTRRKPPRRASQSGEGKGRPPNPAYAALTKAVAAAQGLTGRDASKLTVTFPVVVTDGRLLQYGLRDMGEEILEEVQWQRVLWRGTTAGPVVVDVVTLQHLAPFARRAADGLQSVSQILAQAGRGALRLSPDEEVER